MPFFTNEYFLYLLEGVVTACKLYLSFALYERGYIMIRKAIEICKFLENPTVTTALVVGRHL